MLWAALLVVVPGVLVAGGRCDSILSVGSAIQRITENGGRKPEGTGVRGA
jgi:hypothetical protein